MRRTTMGILALGLVWVLLGAAPGQNVTRPDALALTSTAFGDGRNIPSVYTCVGKDISPPLSWANVSERAKSLALTCVDPDASGGRFVHWVVYGIQPAVTGFPENQPRTEFIAGGAVQGKSDFGRLGWGGPCPPPGLAHHYIFTLYALDTNPDLKPGLTLDELNAVLKDHLVAESRLTGMFRR